LIEESIRAAAWAGESVELLQDGAAGIRSGSGHSINSNYWVNYVRLWPDAEVELFGVYDRNRCIAAGAAQNPNGGLGSNPGIQHMQRKALRSTPQKRQKSD
jgi:hypothetical protein